MNTITNPCFPISFRRGGPNDEYGIWFHCVIGHQDLLADPEMLCRYLDLYDHPFNGFASNCLDTPESRHDCFTPFIPVGDEDQAQIPSVDIRFDWNELKLIWRMDTYDDDSPYFVDYRFDHLSVCTKVEDCIAALYSRFVVCGAGTAYGDRLTIGKMGQIMKTMLSRSHPSCRETAVPMIQEQDFSMSFSEIYSQNHYTSGNLLQARINIGSSSHVFNVNRDSFNFKQLRHDLENFIYHDKMRLEIIDENGWISIVINAERQNVLNETIPITVGSNNRFEQLLFVTVEECELDEKETKVVGFCDIVSSLKSFYEALSDAAHYYSRLNDEKDEEEIAVWQEDFLSKDFINYLQSKKKEMAGKAAYIRKHYAYAGMEMEESSISIFRNPINGHDIVSEDGDAT